MAKKSLEIPLLTPPPLKSQIYLKKPEEAPPILVLEELGTREGSEEPILPVESPEIPEIPLEVPPEKQVPE
jgi:hypothetical protein